jgi:hypothetical protein
MKRRSAEVQKRRSSEGQKSELELWVEFGINMVAALVGFVDVDGLMIEEFESVLLGIVNDDVPTFTRVHARLLFPEFYGVL